MNVSEIPSHCPPFITVVLSEERLNNQFQFRLHPCASLLSIQHYLLTDPLTIQHYLLSRQALQ